ncbi:MAG: chemotaxis protein CheW [Iodobacter sp.]
MTPLLQQFLLDGRESLEEIGQKLLLMESHPDDEEIIGALFRQIHTLKGNSGLFEFQIMTRVVHGCEELLDRVRDDLMEIDAALTDELLAAMDFVGRLFDEIETTGLIPDHYAAEAAHLSQRLNALLPECAETAPLAPAKNKPVSWQWLAATSEALRADAFASSARFVALHYQPEAECFFKGDDPLLTLRQLPGLQLMHIAAAADWPPANMLDIYQANLVFNALSDASEAAVSAHLRYVSDQITLCTLPATALAIPHGKKDNALLYQDFISEARILLSAGQFQALDKSATAMLATIHSQLWMASALRWLCRLLAAQTPLPELTAFIEAIGQQNDPGWQTFLTAAPASPPPPLLPALTSSLLPEDEAIWGDMLQTQRRLMDLPVPAAQWPGRLAAIVNTLTNLYRARYGDAALPLLSTAGNHAQSSRSFAPLIALLEQDLSAVPAGSGDNAELSGRRAEDSTERGIRILKVPQEKVDRLLDLIGEMVVAKNALPYLAMRAETVFGNQELAREIKAQYAVIHRIAEEMQDGIMQVRMLPVGAVFQRFSRLVRDVAKKLGKEVRLVIEGEETEADKNIVEALADPLIHILRNSLDHGIELPHIREAAGKSREGRLTVRAHQEGDHVFIEVEDDGKGISAAVVKRKAHEKGLIDDARLAAISDEDAVQLVFAAGFSTAEAVSDLSGRGVGMDVVRTSLEKVGGSVKLNSTEGQGTRIVLCLPLSMSVSRIMMIRIADQLFGIPLESVVETVRVPAQDIHLIKQQRAAVLRGRIVPLYGMDLLLQLPNPPAANDDGEFAILVARVGGETLGLIVDGFAQTIDVLLKPLEGPLAGMAGFAGTALLGDGSVLLVLDIKELI